MAIATQEEVLTDRICDITDYADLLSTLKSIEPYLPSEEEVKFLRAYLKSLPRETTMPEIFGTEKAREILKRSMYSEELEKTGRVLIPGHDLRYGFYWTLADWYAKGSQDRLKEWEERVPLF